MFNLSVHNFRSFQNQKFNFSKVNILIGENSGGKSSLLKLLMAFKQTIDSPSEVNLKLSGDLTDLGNYEEVIYYRKKNRKLTIGFESNNIYFDFFENFISDFIKYYNDKPQKVKEIISNLKDSETSVNFDLTSKLNDHSSIKTTFKNSVLGTMEIIQKKGRGENSMEKMLCDIKFNFKEISGVIENCESYKNGFFTFVDKSFREKCDKKYKENFDYIYYNIAFLLSYQNYLEENFNKIRFVNPIGSSPKRLYFKEDKKSDYKLINIEKFINIISDKSQSKQKNQVKVDLLNNVIREFGIANEIKIISNEKMPVLALNVLTKDFWSNITDVGYGVSLQIPILFQAILSEHFTRLGETILVEQPEVHLHPSLQAKFIETILGIGPKNTYFIETHSEHIVRKLQVLIKNESFGLKPEDISIHYFKRDLSKFSITEHKISETGKLNPPFPSGFFDTSYSLVKQLL